MTALPSAAFSSADFTPRLERCARAVESALQDALCDQTCANEIARPPRLIEAMRHAGLAGGKRLRPFLVIESAALFGVSSQAAMPTALALECVHCYSLAHDDLPAMDNADTRRGRPALHKAFDEATAILAGDALLTLAFDLITREEAHPDAHVRIQLTRALARMAGVGGMAGGQMLDLTGEGRFGEAEKPDVAQLQQMKTGALLRFACIAGALLGKADQAAHDALDVYGRALG